MLILTLLAVILVVGIILIKLGKKWRNDDTSFCGGLLISLFTLCTIVSLFEIQWPRQTELLKAEYTELQREAKTVSELGGHECDLNILAKKDLFEDIREMNKTIDKHRIYSTSLWLNLFYSKEFGNLQKIDYTY